MKPAENPYMTLLKLHEEWRSDKFLIPELRAAVAGIIADPASAAPFASADPELARQASKNILECLDHHKTPASPASQQDDDRATAKMRPYKEALLFHRDLIKAGFSKDDAFTNVKAEFLDLLEAKDLEEPKLKYVCDGKDDRVNKTADAAEKRIAQNYVE